MRKSRIAAMLMAVITGVTMTNIAYAQQQSIDIKVTPSEEQKTISPYIYGVNTGVDLNQVSAGSMRLGGNRLSAYNWENNVSNAGSDWHHNSDMYLVTDVDGDIKKLPGSPALQLSRDAKKHDIPYTLLTLQMLGYTSSDKMGAVKEEKSAPSEFWNKVINRKGSELTLTPDTKDGYVYMDEYINYLINTLGDSSSETGIKAYALDNEPALWHHTHSRVQSQQITCAELMDKSIDLAKTIKEMDSGAEVFGPSLFGYSAFDNFSGASDWKELRRQNLYRWFVDYYLDEMSKAEKEYGTRLLDVLDIHFYTEQRGACGERSCSHYDNDECVQARLDSVRSLYEKGYRENSWITDTGARLFPLLPYIERSINTYYPGTKLAFSEYNFGGGDHISGAVVQADMLGIFAKYGVYFASIWSFDKNEYQLSAINMFTNYDGKGNGFGDTLVKSEYDNKNISVYSSIDKDDENKVKVMVINRSIHDEMPVNITLSSNKKYIGADVYSLYGNNPEIKKLKKVDTITGNSFSYTLPALSVTEFIVNSAGEIIQPDDTTEKDESSVPPSTEATTVPSTEATTVPSTEATTVPSTEATTVPSTEATTVPSTEATTVPSTEATTVPSTEATTAPSTETTEPSTDKEPENSVVDSSSAESSETEKPQDTATTTGDSSFDIPPLISETESTDNTSESLDESADTDGQSDGISIPLIAGIGAGALALVGGVVVLICYLRKRKNDN